jgi:iron complex outermembrane receptor protein
MSKVKHLGLRAVALCILSFVFEMASAQTGTVKGTVKDAGGSPLQGASVTARETKNGANTDAAGNYSLNLPSGSHTLEISYVGFQTIRQTVVVTAGSITQADINLQQAGDLSGVVVIGSRSSTVRSQTQTAAPVDIISAKDLQATGQVEPTQMIALVAPSFNSSRQTIADGTDHIDPATLRGLGPDQVLVLMNGKRRYNTALINVNGTIGRGSVGTDLNSIPFSAIERIEILRDGASSQYGSDAIAGVVNVVLKRSKGTNFISQLGQQYKGDGEVAQIGISHGFDMKKQGSYLVLSLDARYRGATNRVGDYTGPVYVNWNVSRNTGESDADFITRKTNLYNQDQAQITSKGFDRSRNLALGNSQLKNISFMLNGGFKISGNAEFYYSASAGYRHGKAAGLYRYSYQTTQVIPEIYPNGFLPLILSDIIDKSAMAGIKFQTNGWHWDISNTFGGNSFEFDVARSNNATQFAMGANAPTEFYSGKLKFNQNTFNADISKDISDKVKGLKSLNIAGGAEFRVDMYGIDAGEEASYKNYDPNSGKAGGAQVFPGFQPDNEVDETRSVIGGYVDIESDITDKLLANVAGRYENYSDFGGNVAGKLALRYKLSDVFALRGAISNGFRAPSIHQRYFSAISTVFVTVNGVLTARQVGTFRNNSDVAKAFGIPSLEAEKSWNGSVGFTVKPSTKFTLTVDGYFIHIDDRIVLTGQFARTNATVNTLLAAYPDINAVQFFTNAVNTETKGIDVVSTYRTPLGGNQSLDITLAGNFNETKVVGPVKGTDKIPADQFGNVLFNRQEKARIELAQPRSKVMLSASYRVAKLTSTLRFTRYGEVETYDAANPLLDEKFDPKIVTDLSFSYRITRVLQATIGANNIFDVYPDQVKNVKAPSPFNNDAALDNASFGRIIYSRASTQFGFNGGFYFLSLGLNF